MMSFMNPSRAFRRGFAEGFTAPLTLLAGRRTYFTHSHIASDAAAWREVGSLLNQAYREVGDDIGKSSIKTLTKFRHKDR